MGGWSEIVQKFLILGDSASVCCQDNGPGSREAQGSPPGRDLRSKIGLSVTAGRAECIWSWCSLANRNGKGA